MKKSYPKNLFPLCFLFGIGLITSGLGWGYIRYQWDVLSGVLIFIGACLIVWALSLTGLNWRRRIFSLHGLWTDSPTRYFILLTVLIILLNYIVLSYDRRIDLTRAKQHTLSITTQQILKNLKADVRVDVFYVGLAPNYISDILKEFEKSSQGKVTFKISDPLVDLGYVAQFGDIIKSTEKKVVIQSAKERKDMEFDEKNPLTEEMLANGILKVTRPMRKIYFVTGHSEYDINDDSTIGLSSFKKLLEENNADVWELTLGIKNKIPADGDVLVVPGPKTQLSENDRQIIQNYLEQGGKAFILVEATPLGTAEQPLSEEDKQKNPSLNEILNRWGLVIGEDVVVDLENHIGTDVGCPATKNYPPHKEIVNGLDYTFYIRPRSVTIDPKRAPGVNIAPLVKTTSPKNSWAETSRILQVKFDKDVDLPGPVTLGAVIWEPKNDKKKTDTKLIVFTDADFMTNAFIDQFSNATLALNSIFWLSDLDAIPINKNQDLKVETLNLTSQETRVIVVILFLIPVTILGLGFCVWWRQHYFRLKTP